MRHSRGVVRDIGDGGVANVIGLTHNVGLGNEPSMFEVTVSDKALGVVEGHQVVLDVSCERLLPDVRVQGGVKEHASHTWLGSISGSQQCRLLGDKLHEVGWPGAEASSQMSKVSDVGAEVLSDVDLVALPLEWASWRVLNRPANPRMVQAMCCHSLELTCEH